MVYFFRAGVSFSMMNAKFWPLLAHFDQFWQFCRKCQHFLVSLFTGLDDVVVYQIWQIWGMLSVLWPMAFQKWLVYCLYCFWDIFSIWIWTPFAIYSKLQSATRYFAWNCNIVYDWIEIVILMFKLGQIDTMVEYQCSLGGQKSRLMCEHWAVDHGHQNKRNPKHQNLKHCDRGTPDPRHWVSNHYWVLEANQRASKYLPNFRLVLFGKVQDIYVTTVTNPCNNFDKSIEKRYQVHVTTVTNPCNNF